MVGQAAQQAHRVNEHHPAAVRQLQPPRGGVQGGEELILRQHPRLGEGVKEGGFPHVGVPHNGHGGDAVLPPPLPQPLAALGQLFQLAGKGGDAPLDVPAVHLLFALPGSPSGAAATASATPLAGKLHPPPRQTGQLVPQLGKLHLELTLGAHRPLGKDIQNQHSAVDDRAVQLLLQVADLEGGKLVVKDYRVRPAVSDKLRQLLQPSRPQAGGGVRLRPLLGEDAGALISGGGRQLPQLLHGSVHIVCTGVHPRQHGQGGVLGVVFVHDPGSFPVGFWGLPQPLFLP